MVRCLFGGAVSVCGAVSVRVPALVETPQQKTGSMCGGIFVESTRPSDQCGHYEYI